MTTTPSLGTTRIFWCLLFLGHAAACSSKDADVFATIGKTELRSQDLALARERSRDLERAKLSLIDDAVLAEGAVRAGLDRTARVAAQLERARRDVLAQAILDAEIEKQTSVEALKRRYNERKHELARERVTVAHIVVYPGPVAAERLSLVTARLRAGEPFADVARTASEDRASAERGGTLPPLDAGTVEPAFFGAARSLKAGQTSDPVQTQFGFHVIHALADPEVVVPSFDEARSALEAQVTSEARTALLAQLRKSLTVRQNPKFEGGKQQ